MSKQSKVISGSNISGTGVKPIPTRYNPTDLLEIIDYDRSNGSLNFYFDTRETLIPYLSQIKESDLQDLHLLEYPEIKNYTAKLDQSKPYEQLLYLVLISYFSLKYLDYYLPQTTCPSLQAIVKLCYSPEMIFHLQYRDPELDVLADIFNNLKVSARKNLHCYDCGTTARWVLYNCIKANRGRFYLTETEIQYIRHDYYYKYPDRFSSLRSLIKTVNEMKASGVLIVGIRFGEDMFGHIFIIEKLFKNGPKSDPTIRFYQSALNSYLLIDYLAHMRYLEHPEKGIDFEEFEKEMYQLLECDSWTHEEEQLFAKWFAFWPQDTIENTRPIRFNHGMITY